MFDILKEEAFEGQKKSLDFIDELPVDLQVSAYVRYLEIYDELKKTMGSGRDLIVSGCFGQCYHDFMSKKYDKVYEILRNEYATKKQ